MTQNEALKLALEALKSCDEGDWSTGHVIHPSYDEDAVKQAIIAIEEALAQPEHSANEHGEPVATFDEVWDSIEWDKWRMEPIRELCRMIISKTTPPQRTWVGLTDEEVIDLWPDLIMHKHTYQFWQNLEAKLKEKNT